MFHGGKVNAASTSTLRPPYGSHNGYIAGEGIVCLT